MSAATAIPDCNAHLSAFGADDAALAAMAREWQGAGVGRVLAAGRDEQSSKANLDLAWFLPGVWTCVGLHPCEVDEANAKADRLEAFRDLAADPMVVAVGEVGLDPAASAPMPLQRVVLTWFLTMAIERGLPVVLHDATPIDELISLWDSLEPRAPLAAMSSFAGSPEDVEALAERGIFLSLGPRSANEDAVRAIPGELLLVNSDARPSAGADGDIRPAQLAEIVDRIAEIRAVVSAELVAQLDANTRRFLR
jgi:TatD DNase family protein